MSKEISQLDPRDQHNQLLESNVHPPNWSNPTPEGRYNLVVIGAGTAGLGAKVALIERNLMGGDCLNVGCVPSKGIISAARIAATVKSAGAFGTTVPDGVSTDFAGVMGRMRKLRAGISVNDSAERFRDLGVDVFFGQGRFIDSDTVDVDGTKLKFKRAVLATGARASAPPITGLDQVPYLTNESLFSLTELPRRFGVIGAGPIGCEMAQSFAQLGSDVFLVESSQGVLPREDRQAAEIVEKSMVRDGVRLLCCGRDLQIKNGDGIQLVGTADGQSYQESVDALLVAVGRAPNVEGLDLESVGVDFDNKGVKVNDRLHCSSPAFSAGALFTGAAILQRKRIRNERFNPAQPPTQKHFAPN